MFAGNRNQQQPLGAAAAAAAAAGGGQHHSQGYSHHAHSQQQRYGGGSHYVSTLLRAPGASAPSLKKRLHGRASRTGRARAHIDGRWMMCLGSMEMLAQQRQRLWAVAGEPRTCAEATVSF